MTELLIAAVTASIGAISSFVLAGLETRLLRRRRLERGSEVAAISRSGIGPFTWAWAVALVVGLVALVVVLLTDAPREGEVAKGAYEQFFGTSAQITAALIIALAIESSREGDGEETAFKLEACLSVALGAVAALAGLIPGLPRAVYAGALTIIPSGVVGGLVGVVAIAVTRRRRVSRGSTRDPDEDPTEVADGSRDPSVEHADPRQT